MAKIPLTATDPDMLAAVPDYVAGTALQFAQRLQSNQDIFEARDQEIIAAVEQLTDAIGNGALTGGAITAGVGASVSIAALTAIVGTFVGFDAAQIVAVEDGVLNYIFLRQDWSWKVPPGGSSTLPTSADGHGQALLWGTATCAGGIVTAVSNVRRTFLQNLAVMPLLTADPTNAVNGDIWGRTDTTTIHVQGLGTFGTGGGGGGNMTFRGVYAGGTTYAINDVVIGPDGLGYVASASTVGHAPPNVTYWTPLGTQGATGATGATGPAGPMGAQGLTWRGAWSGVTTYAAYDLVSYLGAAYIAIAISTNQNPATAGAYWQLFAAAGADGAAGAAGATGPAGSTIYFSNGAPSGGTGINGDYDLNVNNGDWNFKAAGSWSVIASLRGPQGSQGLQGPGGVPGGPAGGDLAGTYPNPAVAVNAVTNAKAAQMAANTIKGNNTGALANALDLTAAQAAAILPAVVGDSGAGGTKGLVPAPGSGDAAAGKYLKADGTFAVPPGTGFTNPMTTAGDMIYGGTAGLPTRLAIGLASRILAVVAGLPAWILPSAVVNALTQQLQLAKGANVASANNLVLGTDGNVFTITGTTQINLISSTNWQAGSVVYLAFAGALTVKHNQAVSGANKPILLHGAVDFVTAANSLLTLIYDGTNWLDSRLGHTTTLTGDVTGSGSGSFATTLGANKVLTANILNANVTLAKLANIADQTILGNNTGGAAAPVALTVAQTRTLLGLSAVRGCLLTLCQGFTPIATGADTAEIIVPHDPVDGTTSITWNVRRISFRVGTAGGSPSVTVERYASTGAFSPTTVGSVTLGAGSYEAANTTSLGTVASNEKLRFNASVLGTATDWTIEVLLGS